MVGSEVAVTLNTNLLCLDLIQAENTFFPNLQ